MSQRTFSWSLMVGEGGFGCVYRGMIKNLENPNTKINIAFKHLNHRKKPNLQGLMVSKEWTWLKGALSIYICKLGRFTAKSDIWRHGVFAYELIAGRRLTDRNRAKSEQKLLD